ncbi:pentapeptide repeat-containing protein [Micromonospora noduli]|nr:pentapeptide repeat-containing protein [Micromonospora noduli]
MPCVVAAVSRSSPHDRLPNPARNESRPRSPPALAAIGALVTSALSIYYTGRSVEATQHQVALQEQGQVTDRFARATEQLGSDQVSVRVGALYSLERLMVDSPADLVTVVGMLNGFVRERARIQPTGKPPARADPTTRGPAGGRPVPQAPSLPDISTDVQAALTVLGRIPEPKRHTQLIDLSATNLTGADLTRGGFRRANFTGAVLRGANLFAGRFSRAQFVNADLAYANAAYVDMESAVLQGALLYKATIHSSNLRGVWAAGADLRRTYLGGTVLAGVHPAGATLAEADLSQADIEEVVFQGVDLRRVEFLDVKHSETADFACSGLHEVRNFPGDPVAAGACR